MHFEVLRREMAEAHLTELMETDCYYYHKMGNSFSEQQWAEHEFLMELPGKWEYSMVAMDEKKIIGYWITSAFREGTHVHRVAISPGYTGTGIALCEAWSALLIEKKVAWSTLIASFQNKSMHSFCTNEGFTLLKGRTLRTFAEEKKIKAEVFCDYFQDTDGNRFVAFEKKLFI